MTSAAFWLVQDFLTVLTYGAVQMPEIFLLSLVYRLLTGDRDGNVSVIWTAFFGGLLWDLRWVGVPGFFTLSYVAVVMMVIFAWNTLPSAGRTVFVIFLIFWAAQLLPAILSALVLLRGAGGQAVAFFGVQQACAVPVSLLSSFFYFQHEKNRNA